MVRILIIMAVSGLVLCAVCLSGAAALGGRELVANGWNWGAWDIRVDEETDDVSIVPAADGRGSIVVNGNGETVVIGDNGVSVAGDTPPGDWDGAVTTREVTWSGAGDIDVGMPADVTYTQGPTPRLTVTGPSAAVERFYAERGELRLRGWSAGNTFRGIPSDSDLNGSKPPRLKIDIVAPGVTKFDLSGSETLTINNYAQDGLYLDLSGAAKVTAKGSARLAEVDINGAAQADLSGLTVDEADVDLSSASRATIGPKTALNADLSGASQLTLTSRPARINRDVSGAASLIEQTTPAPAATKAAAKTK